MLKTVFMVWKDEFSVKSPRLDAQHKRLFELINDLYEAMQQKVGQEQLQGVLRMLEQYSITHFKDEERTLEEFDCPGLPQQREAHLFFKRKLMEFQHQLQKELLFPRDVLVFLKEWLIDHILFMDLKFAPLIEEHDRSERQLGRDEESVGTGDDRI